MVVERQSLDLLPCSGHWRRNVCLFITRLGNGAVVCDDVGQGLTGEWRGTFLLFYFFQILYYLFFILTFFLFLTTIPATSFLFWSLANRKMIADFESQVVNPVLGHDRRQISQNPLNHPPLGQHRLPRLRKLWHPQILGSDGGFENLVCHHPCVEVVCQSRTSSP